MAPVEGVLDRLGIGRKGPREKNPRANRVERLHRVYADWARTLPGWLGSEPRKERKMGEADELKRQHELWIRARADRTPLISKAEFELRLIDFASRRNRQPSEANGLKGLSPESAYRQFLPPEEEQKKRRADSDELAFHFMQHYPDCRIERGGIIKLPDKKRYWHPWLSFIQGQRREVVRLRRDHSSALVLPAQKGEEIIQAEWRSPVGTQEPEKLAEQYAQLARIRKYLKLSMPAREPESVPFSPGPGPRREPPAEKEVSVCRTPTLVEGVDYVVTPAEEENDEPSLYEIGECTVEEE